MNEQNRKSAKRQCAEPVMMGRVDRLQFFVLSTAVICLLALACSESSESDPVMGGGVGQDDARVTNDGGPNRFDDGGTNPSNDFELPANCEPESVLQANGCALSGCHAAPAQANLDLVSDGFESSLLNAESPTEGCEGRLIIDVERPGESLMLQVIGATPPLGGAIDTCQTVMPPTGEMSAEDQACLVSWVHGLASAAQETLPTPEPFEPTPTFSGLRKIKALINGGVPTTDEVSRVDVDPTVLRTLVTEWSTGPAFERKLADFFLVSLQQRLQAEDLTQFDRLRSSREYAQKFVSILEDSFVKTAIHMVNQGIPFTQITTTRTWMVTTANLILLLYPDQTGADKGEVHSLTSHTDLAPADLESQIEQRAWLIPEIGGSCRLTQSEVLDMLFGFILSRRCQFDEEDPRRRNGLTLEQSPLVDADFQDWRLVEFVPSRDEPALPLVSFYDVAQLRNIERVATRIPRVGFFTTNAFLNNWATNVDNLFRVTTNQSLLVALNIGFSSSEATEPVSDEGLDAEHAASAPSCYGCHKQLDPMRLYLGHDFDVAFQLPPESPSELSPFDRALEPSFAFRGHRESGGDTYRFAEIMSEHPRFAHAWVQKLCVYANSERCSEYDPAFLNLVEGFVQSEYDFKSLWVEVFSSSLVSGFAPTDTYRRKDPLISVTRLNHLCPILQERTGRTDVCEVRRVSAVKGLIPRDEFARGAVDPTQPALSSAFHFSAAEAVCEEVARTVVTGNSDNFAVRDPELIPNIVTQLMGLPNEHERYQMSVEMIQAHYDACIAGGLSVGNAARAAFTLACLTPDVMGVGL
jgi:hypothetical protein